MPPPIHQLLLPHHLQQSRLGSPWTGNLFPCPNSANSATSTISYCCGLDSIACCNNGSYFSVLVGTLVLRSLQATISATALSSSGSSQTTIFGFSMSTTSAATAIPSSASSNPPSVTSLAVGLGVGIPLGLALIVLLCLLLRQQRQYNKAVAEQAYKNTIVQPTLETNTQAVRETTFNHSAQNALGYRDQIVEAFSSPIHEI